MARPSTLTVLEMILKSEGFHSYVKLAQLTHRFIEDFTNQKNIMLYQKEADSDYIDRSTERLVVRDLKIAVRFAILLRDQEWRGYLNRVFQQ